MVNTFSAFLPILALFYDYLSLKIMIKYEKRGCKIFKFLFVLVYYIVLYNTKTSFDNDPIELVQLTMKPVKTITSSKNGSRVSTSNSILTGGLNLNS